MQKPIKLITLYTHICESYKNELQWEVKRFSPNGNIGQITDEELLTIYLFCTMYEQKTTKRAMYEHIIDYWHSWFPALPSNKNFSVRLNNLVEAFQLLLSLSMEEFELSADKIPILIGDSMPVITCSHKRRARVAPDLADKSYCATKNLHYFGVKIHALNLHRKTQLPFPVKIGITPASAPDITTLRPVLEVTHVQAVFLDKAYCDKNLKLKMKQNENELLTPIKKMKGVSAALNQFDKAANDLFSTAVSTIRQPIESFFNWIQEKTKIQIASKVRSKSGLLVHIYAKLVASVLMLLQF